MLEEDKETRTIELELNRLEWEIINIALASPIRDILIYKLRDMGYEVTDEEMEEAWDSASDKWDETWVW